MIDLSSKLVKHESKEYRKRDLSLINAIVIHHSGTESGSAEAFANYHVNTRQWPGIGYHYVIDKKGEIFKTNQLDVRSYGVSGNNDYTVNICLIGDFNKNEATEKQVCAARNLVKSINSVIGKKELKFHSDYKATKCPGDNLKKEMFI